MKYTQEEVVSIIKNYHMNLRYTQEILEEAYHSVGVSQYGIDAAMPHGSGTSNPTERQVVRTVKASQHLADKLTDMKYIQDRTYRITNERDAIVLYSFMAGKTQRQIANMMEMTDMAVHFRVKNIAMQLMNELSTSEL